MGIRTRGAGDCDDVLKARETTFGDYEPAGVVCKTNDPEKSDDQRQWRESDGECSTGDSRGRYARREQKAAAPSERTELRSEAKPIAIVPNSHARDQGEAHADMVAVRHDYIVELFELFAELEKCRTERGTWD